MLSFKFSYASPRTCKNTDTNNQIDFLFTVYILHNITAIKSVNTNRELQLETKIL